MTRINTPRRKLLYLGGLGLTSLSSTAAVLTGCSNSTSDTSDTTNDLTTDPVSEETWASGGTDRITVSYPDDSLFVSNDACAVSLTESTTLGPCYFQDSTGEDISEGLAGLPMQLCLRLIDADCEPLAGYAIEVWHCDTNGVYSGDTSESEAATSFAGDFCTGADESASQSSWYRGMLTTDSNGRVNFKSCFPGWYSGRTIHIHFRVTTPSGIESVISQFCFNDELAREICTTHDLYSARGEQDTTLASGTDTVFPSSDNDNFVLNTQQNTDNTLLAWHTIQVT